MSESYTVERQTLRASAKVLDSLAGLLMALGLPIGNIEEASVIKAAVKAAGTDDFGDRSYEETLRQLLKAAAARPLTNIANIFIRTVAIKALGNRAAIEDYVRRHPEVEDIQIEKPVFILGFPRTGTTLLQNLLSLDEGHRALQFWELQAPIPVHPDPAKDRKKREAGGKQALAMAYWLAPEQKNIHAIGLHTHEECWPLFCNTFAVMNFDLQSGFTEFGRHLLKSDMTRPYAEYKRMLKIMAHWQRTTQFVLKCPEHLWFLDALLEVFPDARIVWTHRDPVASVASYSSLISLNRRMLYGHFDPKEVGAHTRERFLEGVTRGMEARDRHGDESVFFDVDFQELVRDTEGMLTRIKDWAGLPHDRASQARVRAWLAEKRDDTRGAHRYSTEQYDLDVGEVHDQYRTYIDRFSIPLPSAG